MRKPRLRGGAGAGWRGWNGRSSGSPTAAPPALVGGAVVVVEAALGSKGQGGWRMCGAPLPPPGPSHRPAQTPARPCGEAVAPDPPALQAYTGAPADQEVSAAASQERHRYTLLQGELSPPSPIMIRQASYSQSPFPPHTTSSGAIVPWLGCPGPYPASNHTWTPTLAFTCTMPPSATSHRPLSWQHCRPSPLFQTHRGSNGILGSPPASRTSANRKTERLQNKTKHKIN